MAMLTNDELSKAIVAFLTDYSIEITPHDRKLVLDNCLRCHGDLVAALRAHGTSERPPLDCLHCHAGAGHSAAGQ